MTNEKIITKLNVDAVGPRQRSTPIANATPSGTAMSVVSADSRRVWITALCSVGSCSTECRGSVRYQRSEKPCQVLCDLPSLKENRTASPMGSSDHTRYSQVNPSRNHGCRQGLRRQPRSRWAAARACHAAQPFGIICLFSRPGHATASWADRFVAMT